MEEQFRWALIESAAKSAHCEELVRPFPRTYLQNGEKDFGALIADIEARSVALFQWLQKTLPKLQHCVRNLFIKKYFSTRRDLRPDMILSVQASESKETRFYKLIDESVSHSTTYCFHGSKPENFFSILQHGLVNNLNKRDLFGSGTYLSTEINVALQFAQPQRTNIELSDRFVCSMRCVALCEVAESVGGVSHSSKNSSTPETYLVVTNDDAILVRYVLVYFESFRMKERRHVSLWCLVLCVIGAILLHVAFYVRKH